MKRTNEERGAALLLALIVTVAMGSLVAGYLFVSGNGVESGAREIDMVQARLAAEEGAYRSIAEIKAGEDPGGDGIGVLTLSPSNGRVISVTIEDLGGNLRRIRSLATLPRARYAMESIIEVFEAAPLRFEAKAAIAAKGDVTTLGSITVDGRDWDGTGSFVRGPGVLGISSTKSISTRGASSVGGNGSAPSRSPGPGAVKSRDQWTDGTDDDGDGVTDEELYDGIDNDGDGRIDEDTHGYPTTPDTAVGLPDGELKAIAQRKGTYFQSQAELSTYLAAHGGNFPGGQIIYLDMPSWQPADFGSTLNAEPSIVVHHQSNGLALMKNVHGAFKGLVLADFIEHINGSSVILGSVMSFANEAYGNSFGNGNAQVLYSSDALGGLPSGSGETMVRVLGWRKTGAN